MLIQEWTELACIYFQEIELGLSIHGYSNPRKKCLNISAYVIKLHITSFVYIIKIPNKYFV